MAHAAEKTVVTVEKIHDGNLLDDPLLAAGTLPGFYVESVAVAARGAWPLPLPDHYAADAAHLAVCAAGRDAEGFASIWTVCYAKARRDLSIPPDGEGGARRRAGGVFCMQMAPPPSLRDHPPLQRRVIFLAEELLADVIAG